MTYLTADWDFYEILVPQILRGAAVMIVYLPLLMLVIVLAVVVMPRFIADTRALSAQLPVLIEENVLKPLEQYVPVGFIRNELRKGVELPRSIALERDGSNGCATISVGSGMESEAT